MTIDGADPITVCTYGFNIPCRRFLIRANVTRDRRLPVVDEFVLRALKLCERLPVRRIGAYFGFSDAETETVMADLVGSGLVVVEGDAAYLHSSAHEHFRGADDGIPRVVEVDAWVERIWFDLVSRNMMSPERSRPKRYLIDIRPDGMARELPAAYARKSFEGNFAEYLRKVRRIANPDQFGLYSVSDVEPERFGSVVLRGREDLIFDPQPRLRPHLVEVETENLVKYRPLANALNDAYRQLSGADPSSAGLAEFFRFTGDPSVAESHNANGFFDFPLWLSANAAKANVERHTLIGASYLPRNIDFFSNLLEKGRESKGSVGTSERIEILWFRPGGSNWGVTPDLQEALLAIKAGIRRKHGKTPIRTKLIVPQIARRENPRRFDQVFDEGYLAPAGHLSPSTEVIHISGIGSIVLVRVAFSSSVSAFVGFALVDLPGVQLVERILRWEKILPRSEELWAKPVREGEEPQELALEGDDVQE